MVFWRILGFLGFETDIFYCITPIGFTRQYRASSVDQIFGIPWISVQKQGFLDGFLVAVALNTLGAICGSMLIALVFVPLAGAHGAERVLIIVSAISAAVAVVPLFRSSPGFGEGKAQTELNCRRGL
jgi:hypothetical protein